MDGDVEMYDVAHVPLAAGAADHAAAVRPQASSPAAARAHKLSLAARPPKMMRMAVRAALANEEFGSIAFGPGSPFVVTGSRCGYVLLRDVRMRFGQSTIGSMHLDRALLQTVGVHVQDNKDVCRACKKLWSPIFRCCDKWAPPGGGGAGAKKRTLFVGVARRDVLVDDDDEEEEEDGDIGAPRVDEAMVAPSPIPARTSRSCRSVSRKENQERRDSTDDELPSLSDDEDGDKNSAFEGDEDEEEPLDSRTSSRASCRASRALPPPPVERDRDMSDVNPAWPPRDAALRKRLARTPLGKLLLKPDSPFVVTGSNRDAVAAPFVCKTLKINDKGRGVKWWDEAIMAEIGLSKKLQQKCCKKCEQLTASERRCCEVWDQTNGKPAKSRRVAVVGLARRTT
ncbi:hypothetical protein GGF31_000649 [Allomyces arbusculus]|nr:hypothetical protein GGF31_000649 [Allomyces arbusculus]